jgi:zinc finger SWIM domain-containing protein 3
MYEHEDEATFEDAFNILRSKMKKQTWLDSIYKERKKWVECYMKDVFTLGMRSTQLSESLNSDLKRHFKSDFDIIRFLKQFERVVEYKRKNELQSEFEARKKLPRIKMRTPMLIQASKLYTSPIFEAFQNEYERSMVACTMTLECQNEYIMVIGSLDENPTFEKQYKVIGDPSKQTSTCNYGHFNRIGILYGHALKVLDLMNIKTLPTQYILNRWTREARSATVHDNQGRNIIENPKLDEMLRYKDMSHKFQHLAHRAASHPNCCLLVHNALDMVSKQVEEELNGVASPVDPIITPTNVSLPTELLSTTSLKKKEVETKTSKRIKAWYEKKRKCVTRKKGGINKENSTKVCDKKKEKSSKACDKKKQKCSKVSDNSKYI